MRRLRSEGGFGLIETLIALTVVNVALLALVASLNSGAVALVRAGSETVATTLAQEQLELYRAVPYESIALDTAAAADATGTDTTYACDEAITVDAAQPCSAANRKTLTTTTCLTPLPQQCLPTRTVGASNGRDYRIDTYIVEETPATPSDTPARSGQVVTIVVRDADDPAKVLARILSTFDRAL